MPSFLYTWLMEVRALSGNRAVSSPCWRVVTGLEDELPSVTPFPWPETGEVSRAPYHCILFSVILVNECISLTLFSESFFPFILLAQRFPLVLLKEIFLTVILLKGSFLTVTLIRGRFLTIALQFIHSQTLSLFTVTLLKGRFFIATLFKENFFTVSILRAFFFSITIQCCPFHHCEIVGSYMQQHHQYHIFRDQLEEDPHGHTGRRRQRKNKDYPVRFIEVLEYRQHCIAMLGRH